MSNSRKMTRRVLVVLLSAFVAIAMGQFITQSSAFAATGGGQGGGHGSYENHDGGFGPGDFGGHDDFWDDDEDADEEDDADLTIAEDPESATYAVGNYADDLYVEVEGDDSDATYQWYANTSDDNENGTAIVGATDAELDGDSISTAAAGVTYYYCVVTDSNGDAIISDTAAITVQELAITTQPKSGSYAAGKTVTLSVAFIGNGDVQWYSSSDGDTWTEIDGADETKYKASIADSGTTYYHAVVTNGLDSEEDGYASVTSHAAKIVVSGSAKTTVGKFAYKITGDTTVTLVGVSKKTYTALVVPATVEINGTTYDVTAIGASAFKSCTKLRTLTIGENVKTIGASAFKGDSKLKTVKFSGASLTSVGKNAFKGVYRTVKFSIPTDQLDAYKTLLRSAGAPRSAKYLAY